MHKFNKNKPLINNTRYLVIEENMCLSETISYNKRKYSEIYEYAIELSQNLKYGWKKELIYRHVSLRYVIPKHITKENLM